MSIGHLAFFGALLFSWGCLQFDEGPPCSTDADCVDPLICFVESCIDGCRDNTDCPAGLLCSAAPPVLIGDCHECSPVDVSNCQPGEVCSNSFRCADCLTSSNCPNPGTEFCWNNECVDPGDADPIANVYTTSTQLHPRIAVTKGDFVVTWDSYTQDGDSEEIIARRFDASGAPMGNEFQVNTFTSATQLFPDVAMDGGGNFVIVWQDSSGQDGDEQGVRAQRFLSDGTPSGAEFQVNTYTPGSQSVPVVAMDVVGNFVVAWENPSAILNGAFAQRFLSDGTPTGSEFRVNTNATQRPFDLSVAMAGNGVFVVVWANVGPQDGSEEGVFGQRYLADGTPSGAEFLVNAYTTESQRGPSVVADFDGDFLVVWNSRGQDGSGWGVFGQRFTSNGNPQGGEFQVNTYTADHQFYPDVTLDPTGGFLTVWRSDEQDGSDGGVFAQRFADDGARVGEEFRINSHTVSDQRQPAIAASALGDFIVTWESGVIDGDLFAIALRVNPPPQRESWLLAEVEQLASGGGAGPAYSYATNPEANFSFSDLDPGVSAIQRFTFKASRDDLETYSALWAYPEGFSFAGFTAVSPPGSAIGSYSVDVGDDGVSDFEASIRSVDANRAYVDLDGLGSPAGDPVVLYLGGSGVSMVLKIPWGGDGDAGAITLPMDARASIEFDPGVIINPLQDVEASLQIELTSVDPDTGDFNDRQGVGPLTYYDQNPIPIGAIFGDSFESGDTSVWSGTQ